MTKQTKKRTRLAPQDRKDQLLLIANQLAEEQGLLKVNHQKLADKAGVSLGLVFLYFGGIEALRKTIGEVAAQEECRNIYPRTYAEKTMFDAMENSGNLAAVAGLLATHFSALAANQGAAC
mgnify:CR=1 FL=1